VRQAGVTTRTYLVAGANGHSIRLLRVTVAAQFIVRVGEREGVRLMALGAGHPQVEAFVGMGGLVAAAAGLRRHEGLGSGWVWIVTTGARTPSADLRMIRMHVRVTICAGFFRASAHIVRGVAARALGVCLHGDFSQDVNRRVARAASDGRCFGKPMRFMTADALGVALVEQGAGRHDRLLFRVAGRARTESLRRRRVLMLVTRSANLHGRLVQRSVGRRNVLVTIGTLSGLRCAIFMRVMTVQALARAVNPDRDSVALRGGVAADALRGGKGFGQGGLPVLDARPVGKRKGVTRRAVRLDFRAEALRGLNLRMANTRFLLVASGAASGRRDANRIGLELVALSASHVLFDDVHLVTLAQTRALPGELHADARNGRRVRTGHADRQGEHEQRQ
jgi:hypothetical protein